MANKLILSDNKIRNIKPDAKKRLIVFDERQPGLALQITPAGTKTFQFRHHDKNRQETKILTLGRYPDLPLNQAREKAAELLTQINQGVDIEDQARQVRQESTLDQLFDLWLQTHARPHKRTWTEDQRRYDLYIRKPMGKKRLSWFTPDKVRAWHQDITRMQKQKGADGETIAPATANRALALLSTIFSAMVPDRPNPCQPVRKFKEESRDRFLTADEMQRFFAAVEHPDTRPDTRDYLLVSLFTGARRGNVLAMKWSDIDLNRQVWTIPASESKNGRPMDVPMIPQVVDILQRRKRSTSSIYVFPGPGRTGHLLEPRKGWLAVLRRAGLTGLRLHDLRRSCGSWMAMTGVNLPTISKALGHQNQATTAVYARVDTDPVRFAMEKAAAAMEATRDMAPKVVPFKKAGGE